MLELLSTVRVEDLKNGYRREGDGFICLSCGAAFYSGEIYPIDGHYYQPERAARVHVSHEHGSMLEALLSTNSKYLSLTDTQKVLLSLIGARLTDKEIAGRLSLAPSTIRHQRFIFREKAKQAKLYLTLYELATEEVRKEDGIIEIHTGAKMTDERYVVTDAELEKILKLAFKSLSPLKLLRFPPKEKKKVVILSEIAEQFERGRHYTEKEVNTVLKGIFDDYVTLRRYLIEYGFMERTTDCSEYWRKEE